MSNHEKNSNLIIEYIPIIKNYKSNPIFSIIILIIFILLILLMFYKIVVTKNPTSNKILLNRLSTLESELVKSENLNDMKRAEIFLLRKKLETEKKKINQKQFVKLSDFTTNEKIQGKGFEIIVNEPNKNEEVNEEDEEIENELKIMHNEDLLRFVNFLWSKNAEGISINGIRLSENSAIICNGPTITIKGQFISPPFVIDVIGNKISKDMIKKSPIVISFELRGMDVSIVEKDVVLLNSERE